MQLSLPVAPPIIDMQRAEARRPEGPVLKYDMLSVHTGLSCG